MYLYSRDISDGDASKGVFPNHWERLSGAVKYFFLLLLLFLSSKNKSPKRSIMEWLYCIIEYNTIVFPQFQLCVYQNSFNG